MRLTPASGLFAVLLFMGAVLAAEYALHRRFEQSYERVSPDQRGEVRIALSELGNRQVRFFRFLNTGNQEVKFFVGRDHQGTLQVAFDANEVCYKKKRGYRVEARGTEGAPGAADEWLTCNACDKAFRLAEINDGRGGCAPVPLIHRVDGDQLILMETDILTGWRLFR